MRDGSSDVCSSDLAGALSSILGGSAVVLLLFASGLHPLGLSAGVWVLPVSIGLFVGVSLFSRASAACTEQFIARADADVRSEDGRVGKVCASTLNTWL